MKLQMKREALTKLNRQANEGGLGLVTALPNKRGFDPVMSQLTQRTSERDDRGSNNSFEINERFGRDRAI
jgi:hypothetical protein